jgi:hypothetical protein
VKRQMGHCPNSCTYIDEKESYYIGKRDLLKRQKRPTVK